jgi:beta-lactamase regulating signal transducer with metallopeptidase domain
MTTVQFLAEWALRSSLLILSGALLLRALRVKDASIRLAAWTAMLAGSLAIPALTVVLPGLPLVMIRMAIPRATPRPTEVPVVTHEAVAAPVRAGSVQDGGASQRGSGVAPGFDWARLALAIYALVAGVLLLRLCAGLEMSRRLLRSSRTTDRVTHNIKIHESESVAAPVVLGVARPAIVLPADWRTWDSAKLDAVLAHEGSHIRRHDPAVQLLSAIHCALTWHSPLSWFLQRRIVQVAEEASDDAAVAAGHDRVWYAEVLLGFMRRGVRARWQGVAMARYGRPEKRIDRILDGTALSHGVTRWSLLAILALGLPLAYLAAAAHPQSAPRNVQVAATLASSPAEPAPSRYRMHQQVLEDGWSVTPREAAGFESQIARDPDNVALRIRLLSYYYQHMIPEPRLRHIVWLIENRPDASFFLAISDITDAAPNWTGMNYAADYARVKALWLRQAERFPRNAKVLANATAALKGVDPELSLVLLKRTRGAEPNNLEWTAWLAKTYEIAVRTSFAGGYPQIRQFRGSAEEREMPPTFSLPLSEADMMKAELETATDAALVGTTGEMLIRECKLMMRDQGAVSEPARSAAFGEFLRQRAHALEPDNARWH